MAYRDTAGQAGVLGEHYPHRGSSMIFARNEAGGLRCAYHGWLFEWGGRCIELPSEGPASSFKAKVRIQAYVTAERQGIGWLYMGPRQNNPPPLPSIELNLDGPTLVKGTPFKYVRQCNWAQALEGDIDSVHLNFLHTRLDQRDNITLGDSNPQFHVVPTSYGHYFGVRRNVGEDKYYWRINQFAMPFYTLLHDNGSGGKVWMPIDDYTTLVMEWSPARPEGMPREYDDLAHRETARQPWGYKPDNLLIPWGTWRLKADVDNEWLRDRSLEQTHLFLGIYSNPLQDSAVQVTMGAIYDRTNEFLGTTDKAIIAFRRIMIQAAKKFRDTGELPPTVDDASIYRLRGTEVNLPKEMDWIEASEDWRKAYSAGPPPEYRTPTAAGQRRRPPQARGNRDDVGSERLLRRGGVHPKEAEVPEEILITEVEGPKGTAEIFEVTLGDVTKAGQVLEVEYAVVFGSERTGVPSLGEAHLLANQLTGVDTDS